MLSGRQARWKDILANFDFDIEYVEGKANVVADGLSRRSDHHAPIRQTADGGQIEEVPTGAPLSSHPAQQRLYTVRDRHSGATLRSSRVFAIAAAKDPPG